MVLRDAVSKLETFLWILNHIIFKVHNLVAVYPQNIILGQMTNPFMIFDVVVSFYRLAKI